MSPWLQLEMKKPVKNKVCGHTYEEEAIVRMIESKHKRRKKAWWVATGRELEPSSWQAVSQSVGQSVLFLLEEMLPVSLRVLTKVEAGFLEFLWICAIAWEKKYRTTEITRGKIFHIVNYFGNFWKGLSKYMDNRSMRKKIILIGIFGEFFFYMGISTPFSHMLTPIRPPWRPRSVPAMTENPELAGGTFS